MLTIHHIEGFSGEHDLRTLIMLCREDHQLADLGKIGKPELYFLKTNPFNHDKVHHSFRIPARKELVVHLGGNSFIEVPVPLQIGGEPIVAIRREGENLLVSALFLDKANTPRLKLEDNVWEADTGLFDLRYSENEAGAQAWLAIKMTESEPYLDLKLTHSEVFVQGRFYGNGHIFDVQPNGIFSIDTNIFGGNTFQNSNIGIAVG